MPSSDLLNRRFTMNEMSEMISAGAVVWFLMPSFRSQWYFFIY